MCAGLSFPIDKINAAELSRFFTPEEFKEHRKGDLIQTFYWNPHPCVPVEENGSVHLYDWGSRDALGRLPKTGWAKMESVQDGLWDWLSPRIVKIPSFMGYEKRKWFKTPEGIQALKVRYHNIVKIYLLTKKSDQLFLRYTGHDRMPIGKIILLSPSINH